MSLETPDKIRTLQRKLYVKAKAEPEFRFYLLHDKICRADILAHAYALARRNDGSAGVDGVTFEDIELAGVEAWLEALREDLASMTYRPMAVRRVMIPKPGGGERPLGIPTVRDRVAQTAAKLVLEPIFEADFEESAYGYRPKRSAGDAIKAAHRLIRQGYADVVDADLSKYFDTIPHAELMQSVARRVVDAKVLRLIKLWLTSPVETRDGAGKRRMSGGKSNRKGTPQGGVISPLLANLYMNRFLKFWRLKECGPRPSAPAWSITPTTSSSSSLRQSGRGAGVDARRNAQARAFDQRGQDLAEERARGGLRLPGLHVRAAIRPWRQALSRRTALEEEPEADQGQDQRSVEAVRDRGLAGRAQATEPPPRRLVGVLRLWNPERSLSDRRSPRLRPRPALPQPARQARRARRARVLLERRFRETRRAAPNPRQTGRARPVSLT
jgi:retron-type reverse transcriptase